MSRNEEVEYELTDSREEIAAVLSGVADGVLGGSVRVGDDADAVTVALPDELTLEVELESEDDGTSLELELEWDDTATVSPADVTAAGEGADPADATADEDTDPAVAGTGEGSASSARFEVYRDRAEEWRWRLRHDNGNILATSGEGYTRKHNAMKGLRSVRSNASLAEVRETDGSG